MNYFVIEPHETYVFTRNKKKEKTKQPCKSKHAYINENGKWICACGKKLES